jgi:hypothetical protein
MDSIFLILTLFVMKKLLRCLVISAFVLPILIPSTVFAFGGPVPAYGFQDRERYREMDRSHLGAEQTYLRRFETNRGDRFADRFGNDDDQGTPHVNPPSAAGGENAPIDGGLSLLLVAGLGLGVKKAVGKNKASKQDNNDTEA